MKRTLNYLIWGVIAAPLVYLLMVWNQLPEIVPTHFGISGKPDAELDALPPSPSWQWLATRRRIRGKLAVGFAVTISATSPPLESRLQPAAIDGHAGNMLPQPKG